MIITVKTRNGLRITYPDLATAVKEITRIRIPYTSVYRSKLYTTIHLLNPLDKYDVEYFDEYDIRIPFEVVMRMISNLPKPRHNWSTLFRGYKRGRYRGWRCPRHKQGLIHGMNLPTRRDDLPRSSNHVKNWKQFRKTQYHEPYPD